MAPDLDEPLTIDAETLASKRKLRAVLRQYSKSPVINLRMYGRLKAVYMSLKEDDNGKNSK